MTEPRRHVTNPLFPWPPDDWTVDDLLAALPDEDDYPIVGGAPLRASWAGSCERVISYRLQHVEPTDPLPLNVRFAFAVGHAVHEVVQAGLQALYLEGEAEKAGVLEDFWTTWTDGQIYEVPPVGFHADFWRPVWDDEEEDNIGIVTEIKTMQSYPFNRAREEGVQPWHLAQAGIAALGLRASVVEIVYVDKATGQVDIYRFDDPQWRQAAHLALGSMARAAAAELGERIDRNRKHWRCRNCEFFTRCGKDG